MATAGDELYECPKCPWLGSADECVSGVEGKLHCPGCGEEVRVKTLPQPDNDLNPGD